MNLRNSIKDWINQDNGGAGRSFFQITALIVGGVFAMILGAFLVGVILIASPLLTVLILSFLALYGLVALFKK